MLSVCSLTLHLVQLLGQLLLQLWVGGRAEGESGGGFSGQDLGDGQEGGANQLTYLVHLGTVLRGGEGGWVALLLQVHLHELIDGELAGGCVLELCQPDGRLDEMRAVLTVQDKLTTS